MPKPTFFNLDPERRKNIVEAAVEEFAKLPYEQASLSRIVEKSGIAKGSMYQYFEDKLDLYLYIVDLAYEQKRKYVSQALSLEADIFTILEEYYRQSFLFANEFPLLHQVANNFWDSRVLLPQIEEGRIDREQDFYKFLQEAIARGAANHNLDPQAVFFVYHAVGKELIDHFARGTSDVFSQKVLDVLRYGLEARKEE